VAILAADVAGSCRLIGIDEEGALAQLKALLERRFMITRAHCQNTGNGAPVEFGSIVDAVRCAIEIQRGIAEQTSMCRRPGASNFIDRPNATELLTGERRMKSSSMEEYYASDLAALTHFDRDSCGSGS